MKKNVMIVFMLITVLLLAACGGSKTRTFESTEFGIDYNVVFTYSGDKVSRQEFDMTFKYDDLGIESKEEAESEIKVLLTEFDGIDGLTAKDSYTDKDATISLDIDFKKLDQEGFENLPGADTGEDISEGVSMEETAKNLEEMGFTEVE